MKRLTGMAACLIVLAQTSCAPLDGAFAPPPEAPFEVAVEVTRDTDTPLEGVPVFLSGVMVGASDGGGVVRAAITGRQGDSVSLAVRCPQGFDLEGGPTAVTLRRFAPGSPPPTYAMRCAPSARTVVAAIRAENGAGLPVLLLGREIARTDGSGIAHVVLEATPGDTVELVLGTDGPEGALLRPKNPAFSLQIRDGDDYVVLDQKLEVVQKPQVAVKRGPRRALPSRI
jgi:hypothetical protein